MLSEELYLKLLASINANGVMLEKILIHLTGDASKKFEYLHTYETIISEISKDISKIYAKQENYRKEIFNEISEQFLGKHR